MNFSKKLMFSKFVAGVVLVFGAQTAMADAFGLANGRSANMDNMAGLSAEVGYTIGDISTLGLRVNFKVTPDLMVFGDLGQTELGDGPFDLDGQSFGIGAFYQLRTVSLMENTDMAVKVSYHTLSIEEAGCETFQGFGTVCDVDAGDITELAIDGIISGDQLSNTNFGWYGSLGMHMFDGDGGDENELAIGGGVVGDLGFGQWYGGLELIDELLIRLGVRYNF